VEGSSLEKCEAIRLKITKDRNWEKMWILQIDRYWLDVVRAAMRHHYRNTTLVHSFTCE